ncbi:MAG: DUF3108 domain-containing protein [Acidihalobacter sp.]|jgi:hypothetical protein
MAPISPPSKSAGGLATAALALGLLLLAPVAHAGAFGIPFFTAKYALKKFDMTVAHVTISFQPRGDHLVYKQVTEAAGIVRLFRQDVITEQSILPRDTLVPLPIEYRYDHTGGDHDQHAVLRFDRKTLRASGRTPKGDPVHVKIEPDTLDRLSLQLALMQAVAQGRKPLKFTTVETADKLSHYTFHNLGHTRIDTALGKLGTVHIRRLWERKQIRFDFWLAPTLHEVPVKLEQTELKNGSTLSLYLESIHWDK